MKITLSQKLKTELALSITQDMRMSLALLNSGPEELLETALVESRRNPFLKVGSFSLKSSASNTFEGISPPSENFISEQTVSDSLIGQIGHLPFSTSERRLAKELVYCLDERGFLADSLDEMCQYLKTSPSVLSAIINQLQTAVEPVGVFAWSLSDCFRIQLQAKNRFDPIIQVLLDRLDLVAHQDTDAICNLCSVDREDAIEMLADIRALCPIPLMPLAEVTVAPQEPELIFFPTADGSTSVELNSAALPSILADDGLFDKMRKVEIDPSALQYYRDCYRGAAAFVVAMQKRANTMLRIGQQIAVVQQKYLQTGRKLDRRPLTTNELAKSLVLNKSTISRAVNKCRIATRNGVLPAKDFFVRPISNSTGGRTREQVLHRLSILIRAEDHFQPYSDDILAQFLSKANLAVSRRTVAKYRSILGVPGMQRRRLINGNRKQ